MVGHRLQSNGLRISVEDKQSSQFDGTSLGELNVVARSRQGTARSRAGWIHAICYLVVKMWKSLDAYLRRGRGTGPGIRLLPLPLQLHMRLARLAPPLRRQTHSQREGNCSAA